MSSGASRCCYRQWRGCECRYIDVGQNSHAVPRDGVRIYFRCRGPAFGAFTRIKILARINRRIPSCSRRTFSTKCRSRRGLPRLRFHAQRRKSSTSYFGPLVGNITLADLGLEDASSSFGKISRSRLDPFSLRVPDRKIYDGDYVATDEQRQSISSPSKIRLKTYQRCQSIRSTKNRLYVCRGLRHILRQDPDVIMVGEIRDKNRHACNICVGQTRGAFNAHTNNTIGVIRLIDMGVERYLIAPSLSRRRSALLRKLCESCRVTAMLPSEIVMITKL